MCYYQFDAIQDINTLKYFNNLVNDASYYPINLFRSVNEQNQNIGIEGIMTSTAYTYLTKRRLKNTRTFEQHQQNVTPMKAVKAVRQQPQIIFTGESISLRGNFGVQVALQMYNLLESTVKNLDQHASIREPPRDISVPSKTRKPGQSPLLSTAKLQNLSSTGKQMPQKMLASDTQEPTPPIIHGEYSDTPPVANTTRKNTTTTVAPVTDRSFKRSVKRKDPNYLLEIFPNQVLLKQIILNYRELNLSILNLQIDPIKHAALDLKVLFDTYFKKPSKLDHIPSQKNILPPITATGESPTRGVSPTRGGLSHQLSLDQSDLSTGGGTGSSNVVLGGADEVRGKHLYDIFTHQK